MRRTTDTACDVAGRDTFNSSLSQLTRNVGNNTTGRLYSVVSLAHPTDLGQELAGSHAQGSEPRRWGFRYQLLRLANLSVVGLQAVYTAVPKDRLFPRYVLLGSKTSSTHVLLYLSYKCRLWKSLHGVRAPL